MHKYFCLPCRANESDFRALFRCISFPSLDKQVIELRPYGVSSHSIPFPKAGNVHLSENRLHKCLTAIQFRQFCCTCVRRRIGSRQTRPSSVKPERSSLDECECARDDLAVRNLRLLNLWVRTADFVAVRNEVPSMDDLLIKFRTYIALGRGSAI